MKIGSIITLTGLLCASLFAEMREWANADGPSVTGAFERELFGGVLVRDAQAHTHLIPHEKLSPQDIRYLSHHVHPKIEIDCVKKTRILDPGEWGVVGLYDMLHSFTITLNKKNTFPCKDKLTAELYIIADEVDGENYILIRREPVRFVFSEMKESSFSFFVNDVLIQKMQFRIAGTPATDRGAIYRGYIVAVMDSRGRLITYKTNLSRMEGLLDDMPAGIEKLRNLAIEGRGSFHSRRFDESIEKTVPPSMPWYKRTNIK